MKQQTKPKFRLGKTLTGLASAFYSLAIASVGLNFMRSLFEDKDELTEIIKEKKAQMEKNKNERKRI